MDLPQRTDPLDTPPLLPHLALNEALPWCDSLPDGARVTVHEAQLHLLRYNADAQYFLAWTQHFANPHGVGLMGDPGAGDWVSNITAVRGRVEGSAREAIKAFALA